MIVIKYAKLCFDDTVNGNGFRTSIFVSGCSKVPKCKNCWNQVMWSHDYGYEYTLETELKILNSLSKPWVKGLSILGGEPMDNLKDGTLLNLVKKCKELYPNKTIYCWTGYQFENLIKDEVRLEFIKHIDMLRDGEYIDGLKNLNQYLQGSSNQRYIDCSKSLEKRQIIEYKFK